MVTVRAPGSAPRGGEGPTFEVLADPDRYLALEVATDPRLFRFAERTEADLGRRYWGSWVDGVLNRDPAIKVPGSVWANMRAAPRIAFRALSSRAGDAWIDVEVTVGDDHADQAPAVAIVNVASPEPIAPADLDRVWFAAEAEPEFAAVASLPAAEGTLVRHLSGPRRPISPSVVVWVLAVAADVGGLVDEAVVTLSGPDLRPGIVGRTRAPSSSVDAAEARLAAETMLATEAAAHPDLDTDFGIAALMATGSFSEAGPAWVWQNTAPPPAEAVGGTILVSSRTGRVLFAATTSWQGGEILIG